MNESQRTLPQSSYDDEIDLRDLFRVVWAGKWLIVAITSAAIVIAVIIAMVLPNTYRAEALLAPNDQQGAEGLSALAAQYGGLASLAGINIGGDATDKTTLGLEILKSRKFISEFVARHDLLVPLIAARGWRSETGDLIIDADDYDLASGEWIRDASPPRKSIPSMQEAHEEFLRIMSASEDKKTGFITLSVEHYSPTLSKQWVDWLVEDINSTIMAQDVAEAQQAIDYLRDQIESTSVADLRVVFSSLIEEQIKIVMLARVSPEYVFRTVDPAVVPEIKAKPRRVLIAFLGLLLGSLAGIIIVFVRNSIILEGE